MQHKYVYVVTEITSNDEVDADIKVYNNVDSANKDYGERYEFYIRRYNCRQIYARQIMRDNQYDISSTIILYNGSKITIRLVKTSIK